MSSAEHVLCGRCGADFERNPRGGPPKYCPPCRRPAALEHKRLAGRSHRAQHRSKRKCPTCGERIVTGYQRAGTKYCTDGCKPRCIVTGCQAPQRKRRWCASHYAQWRRTGTDARPFAYRWAIPTDCLVCGAPPGAGHRRFCSDACRVRWGTYSGAPPDHVDCIACGVRLSLHDRGKGGQRRKATTKFCKRCKQDYRKYKLSASELAARDGTCCGICGSPVDMTLRREDSNMCASVDHIVPRALGGTHDPENLQLTHLYCNQVKSDLRGLVAPGGVI